MITRSLTHWGLYDFHTEDGRLVNVTPVPDDPHPSALGSNLVRGNNDLRIARPAVRKGYLSQTGRRGEDEFVDVPWDEALDMAANALQSTIKQHGNEAIYGGSYGWASAGRFHHAQSQLHRFLTCIGGYTESVNTYSYAAIEVILPHVVGQFESLLKAPSSWQSLIGNTELMVCFGGLPMRNSQITNGGLGKHGQPDAVNAARQAGIRFVNISPAQTDISSELDARWLPIRPGSDTALLLALCYELISKDLHDQTFVDTYCHGFEPLRDYLMGSGDGEAKTAAWASAITGISAADITGLAEQMASSRTMISLSWSLSRAHHGEQPYWAGIALAALLGQIGLPGGGIGLGYCAENKVGKNVEKKFIGHLPRGQNPIRQFIPVARIADMLLHPGETYRYDGQTRQYPQIDTIYWAGGNPFHHHQDLNRLREAWQRPGTVICHELVWNPMAQHADIVFPVASFLERNDIGGAPNEDVLVAMKQALPPYGESRTDYDIFSALGERLECKQVFTEGRDEATWLRWMYDMTAQHNSSLPAFDEFWDKGVHHLPEPPPHTLFEQYRADPAAHALRTASGRIELSHPRFLHARWQPPIEWLGNAAADEFHLVSHQPAGRLHSQLDHGETSQATKIKGREPLRMNTRDAQRLGLKDDDEVRVYNDRGAFIAGLETTDTLMPGVLHIATGAWWAPDETGTCQNGNPNAVTPDIGTSEIAQGPSALTCLVRVSRIES